MGISQFADWSPAEFFNYSRSLRNHSSNFNSRKLVEAVGTNNKSSRSRVRTSNFNSSKLVEAVGVNNIPLSWDWRSRNVVSSVKNQGNCGACWAFGSVAAVESIYAIQHHDQIDFSVQQLIDCVRSPRTDGCTIGVHTDAFVYIHNHGLERETAYPYQARKVRCRYNAGRVIASTVIAGHVRVQENNEVALAEAVFRQPVTADITAFQHQSKSDEDDKNNIISSDEESDNDII